MEKSEVLLERNHLNFIYNQVLKQIEICEQAVDEWKQQVKDALAFSADNFYTMDDEEIAQMRSGISDIDLATAETETTLKRLKLIKKNAFFGRIDFCENKQTANYYIGVSGLMDSQQNLLVCDWRAPVSSMYYDYEIGNASYKTPTGKGEGEIIKKRQFMVNENDLDYCFDSSLTISDDILQQTLGQDTSQKMKNIVSTIQKEQNGIIRNEDDHNFLVQGVAGSGKTSIALHRAAYLLYKQRNNIKAENILIASPNAQFSDYISSVLPELGENNIMQTTFMQIAKKELEDKEIQSREDMLEKLLANQQTKADVDFKSTFNFYMLLKEFLQKKSTAIFDARDIFIGKTAISKDKLAALYSVRYKEKSPAKRIAWISDYIMDQIGLDNAEVLSRVKKILASMLINCNIYEMYQEFTTELVEKKLLKKQFKANCEVVSNEDQAALLLIKDYVTGVSQIEGIKFFIVDEMQDYSPCAFALFCSMYPCSKIVFGDINQCFEKKLDQAYLDGLCNLIGNCKLINLSKAYRSSFEISKLSQEIAGINYECVQRHAEKPEIIECKDGKEFSVIADLIKNSKHNKTAIICKNNDEATLLFEKLKSKVDIELANSNFEPTKNKIIITAFGCKGIEYDEVIIPFVSAENYKTEFDRSILYVATTRALHNLTLTYTGEQSSLLPKE